MQNSRNGIDVVVSMVVQNPDGDVLFTQRGPDARDNHGMWEFPGGMVEHNEKFADAAARELWEETGLSASKLQLLALKDTSESMMVIVYRVTVADYEVLPKEPREVVSEWRWVNPIVAMNTLPLTDYCKKDVKLL